MNKRLFLRGVLTAVGSLVLLATAHADQDWDGDNGVGNFNNNNNWYGDSQPAWGAGNLTFHFNNGGETSLFFNYGSDRDTHDIFFASSWPTSLTWSGDGHVLNFNQRLENDSSATITFDSSMKFSGAKFGASQIELNPVGGNMVFNSTMFNDSSNKYVVFGSHTLTVGSDLGVGSTASSVSLNLSGTSTNVVIINTAQDYSGGTNISAGTLQLSGSGTAGTSSSAVSMSAGTFDLNTDSTNTTRTIGALSGTGGTIVNNGTGNFFATLVVGQGDGSGSYAGVIADNSGGSSNGRIALTKTGSGTETLTSSNTYTSATTINAGTLKLANGSGVALSGTSGVAINNGGTLLFGASNQINQTTPPPISLGSATGTGTAKLDAGGFSQGTGGTPTTPNSGTVGLGKLTLNSSSIIDMTATSVLHFSNSNSLTSGVTWTGTLSIYDWSGTPITGGGSEQVLFGGDSTGLSAAQLAQIQFYSGSGTGPYNPGAVILSDGEIVPIPEPSTWIAGSLAVLALAYSLRRRFARILTLA